MKPTDHPLLRALGQGIHRLLARSHLTSKLYLILAGAVLRGTPDFRLKANVINSVSSGRWPNVDFGPRKVTVCDDLHLNLVPHPGEFDFRALLSTCLDYEPEVFEVLSARMDIYDAVVEIGANVGVFSAFFGKRLRECSEGRTVLCFEPSREAFSRLRRNLEANRLTNVAAFNCAVGKEDGFVPFHEPKGHLTNGSLSKDFAAIFSSELDESIVLCVSGEKIKDLLGSCHHLLLKIDVKGAERLVLEGLESLIREEWPDIVLEVLDLYADDLNALAVLSENYAFFNIVPGGVERHQRLEATQYRDYLLVPNSRIEDDRVNRQAPLRA